MKTALLLLVVLITSFAYAGDKEFLREINHLKEQKKAPLTQKEENDLKARGWRDRRIGEYDPPVSKHSRPTDYINDVHRGTIEYSPNWQNYSFHNVEIPDGTSLTEANFSQVAPLTKGIVRKLGIGHNLTFIGCNLTNLFIEDDWVFINSNTTQVDRIGFLNVDGKYVFQDDVYLSDHPSKVNKLRSKPIGALE